MENKKRINYLNLIIVIFPPLFILAFALVCNYGLNIEPKAGVLEILCSILGILACSLNGLRKNFCFYFYVIYSILYAVSAFLMKNYGESILNLLFNLPLYLNSLIHIYFIKNKKDNNLNGNRINSLSKKQLIIALCLCPVITVGYGFILKALGSNVPFFNSFATYVCMCATFCSSRKIKEQWIFWILYSTVSSVIWLYTFIALNSGGLIYLVLNAFCYMFNIRGIINWYRAYDKQKKEDTKICKEKEA